MNGCVGWLVSCAAMPLPIDVKCWLLIVVSMSMIPFFSLNVFSSAVRLSFFSRALMASSLLPRWSMSPFSFASVPR